jgi:hypothetical protein
MSTFKHTRGWTRFDIPDFIQAYEVLGADQLDVVQRMVRR